MNLNLMSPTKLNKIKSPHTKSSSLPSLTISCNSKHNDSSLWSAKKRRRLITISTSDGKWNGNWNSDYLVSLRDLRLMDLVEDEQDERRRLQHQIPLVSVNLSVHKHASFGFSVDGRITTTLTRKCCTCSSPYCREIDATFNVWVLHSSTKENRSVPLPEIGGDPSVIYVKPGNEADLDSLVQDTLRLATTINKDACSESCAKSEPTIHYIGPQNTASMHKRWGRLMELRNAIS